MRGDNMPERGSVKPPLKIIARIYNDFPAKFGIPRQSGLVNSVKSRIIFEQEYRNPDALRGLDGLSWSSNVFFAASYPFSNSSLAFCSLISVFIRPLRDI
jgi:hypothetical protein